jgi:hypothetical protein
MDLSAGGMYADKKGKAPFLVRLQRRSRTGPSGPSDITGGGRDDELGVAGGCLTDNGVYRGTTFGRVSDLQLILILVKFSFPVLERGP